MTKTIVFTGGGTAGHVTPNIALIERLSAENWQIHYIGSCDGMERDLIGKVPNVTYHAISCGKLRRYLSLKNLSDPFRVIKGFLQAKKLLRTIKPDVVFSKGGYVSVPVVMAAGKTPVVAHESDFTPGLSNRIASRFTDRVCVTFEDTLRYVRGNKGVFTGTPIRPELYRGDRDRALRFTGLSGEKPILLAMGGSLGAQKPNEMLRAILPEVLKTFDVIHLCGKGKRDDTIACEGYVQYEYISDELPDLLKAADVVLSRAGANAVFELLALNKPAVLIPLPLSSSRGDQILNAKYFEKKGYALVVDQDTAADGELLTKLETLYRERERFIENMSRDTCADGTETILKLIAEAAEGTK